MLKLKEKENNLKIARGKSTFEEEYKTDNWIKINHFLICKI